MKPSRPKVLDTAGAEAHVRYSPYGRRATFLAPPRGSMGIVARGLGSFSGGGIAARMALEIIASRALEGRRPGEAPDTLSEARLAARMARAGAIVARVAELDGAFTGMSTTVAVAVLDEDGRLVIGHAGDDRIYLLRGTNVTRLTEDDVLSATTEDVPAEHGSLLVRALGFGDPPDVRSVAVAPGDRIVLATGALARAISSQDFERIARTEYSGLTSFAETLVARSAAIDEENCEIGEPTDAACVIGIVA